MRNTSDEDWTWRAHYLVPEGDAPPEWLDEYEGEASDPPERQVDHGFADIDLTRCYAIELVPQRPHLTTHIVRVDPRSGMRPIFFRRRVNPLIFTEDGALLPNGAQTTITVLGWQKNVGKDGTNVQAFTFYFPDGTSLVSDQRNPPMG